MPSRAFLPVLPAVITAFLATPPGGGGRGGARAPTGPRGERQPLCGDKEAQGSERPRFCSGRRCCVFVMKVNIRIRIRNGNGIGNNNNNRRISY